MISSKGPECMGICHHEQDIGLPSKWVFLLQHKGLRPYINYLCSCVKYKDRVLCVQVKNKPYVIYTVMHLIPWKQSHGSETLLRDGARIKFKLIGFMVYF
jgi:hypothetical protein